uniref:CD34 molecule n=1 Tax=Catagonus wagneri TaxID=51154 RepID=A0A8C3WFA8_9CETA
MLPGRGARGWAALCLLSLLPSGFTAMNNHSAAAPGPVTTEISSTIPTDRSSQETTASSAFKSTGLHTTSQGSSGTTAAISDSTVNFTSTSEIDSVPRTANSSIQPQASLATTVSSSTINFTASEMTLKSSMFPRNVSDALYNSTSPVGSPTSPYTSSSPTPSIHKGEIKCSQIKEVKLTQGICLELNETSSCEKFKKDSGETLIRILCGKEQAEAGPGACSLLLAQSEVKPHCLLLVLANRTELSSKYQFLKNHQSELRELGIQNFIEQDVGSHQSYSRKTLIALVTSGVLLAVLGTTGYFLMNRRSWSPAGERLELEP